jgi:hypothetical protein
MSVEVKIGRDARTLTVEMKVGPEYGLYAGTYRVKSLTVAEANLALRNLANGKDKVSYINALMEASVTGPVPVSDKTIREFPYKLYRLLMDKVLELNESSAEEANFLPSSPSTTPP